MPAAPRAAPAWPSNRRGLLSTPAETTAATQQARTGRFTRQQRLLKGVEFKRVFNEGRRSGNRILGVVVAENGLDHARLGLAIAKRQVRTAVGRNRIKRVAREGFRRHQHELAGLDIIVMARNGAAGSDITRLHRAMESLWQELATCCENS